MDTREFIYELSKLRTSSTFLTLHDYMNEAGEVADYNIVFNMSYKNALLRSIEKLSSMDFKDPLKIQARNELLESFTKSLSNSVPVEEMDQTHYTHFQDEDGKYIKGVKVHNETGNLHLYGLIVHKKIKLAGTYLAKNKRPLTLAKDALRYQTPCGKFRQFRLNPSQVGSISVRGLNLLPPEL